MDEGRKKISILIPCYNEEENVVPMSGKLTELMGGELGQYEYEILFIDNDSTDNTRQFLREICSRDKHVRAIFNAKNFGQFNSPYYGIMQTTGDCAIMLCCDFQDPLERLPDMVREWEKGYKIVVMQKTSSRENGLLYFLRSCYYRLLKRFSQVDQIEHFTGFGLYDREFLDILRELKDPLPFLRGIVAELGYKVKIIPYEQERRRAGKTHNNFSTLYDAAMLSFTSYTKVGLRVATFLGFGVALLSFGVGVVYLILKMIYWERFDAGTAPMVIGMFFLGAVILIFLGIMGEYILTINRRIMNRPLVIEEERINFEEDGSK